MRAIYDRTPEACAQHGIRMTIVVYPSPYQLTGDNLEGIPVTFWREFAKDRRIDFLNLFPGIHRQRAAPDRVCQVFHQGRHSLERSRKPPCCRSRARAHPGRFAVIQMIVVYLPRPMANEYPLRRSVRKQRSRTLKALWRI